MHRLAGSEDGYDFRIEPTRHMICLKKAFLDFFKHMEDDGYVIPSEEQLLIANVDASLDELINVYHKILIDQNYDTLDTTLFCNFCNDEE